MRINAPFWCGDRLEWFAKEREYGKTKCPSICLSFYLNTTKYQTKFNIIYTFVCSIFRYKVNPFLFIERIEFRRIEIVVQSILVYNIELCYFK